MRNRVYFGSYSLEHWLKLLRKGDILRMTGAQEQKCICWDFWTLDLEWRNQRYGKKIAEMSCYDEKNHLCS